MNKTKERAMEIIDRHIENIKAHSDIIKSIVLVGSLSDDNYIGNAGSDIDLIHILSDDASENARLTVYQTITKTENETDRDIPISKCIYRYSDLFHPYKTDFELCHENKDYIELPIEVFRMKDSGITVYGDDIISMIDMPAKNDVLVFENLSYRFSAILAEQDQERHAQYLKTCQNPPVRLIAQIVLTRAMLDYYFITGKSCSSKAKIADVMSKEVPDYRFQELLNLSYKWRYNSDSLSADEQQFMINEYREWYQLRKDKPCDYLPLMKRSIRDD